jgi:hypothetical protein
MHETILSLIQSNLPNAACAPAYPEGISMPAVILDFNARLHSRYDELAQPHVPEDITAYEDGAWGCSTDTMVKLMRWFELYGYDFDPTCLFEDLARDLCAILRASTLLAQLHALPSGSAYWGYLHAVRKGNFAETKVARLRAVPLAGGQET